MRKLSLIIAFAMLICPMLQAQESGSAKPKGKQQTLELPGGLSSSGVAVNLAFELTTPSGSHGHWATGGGGVLTVSYDHFVSPQWFIHAGVAGYYTNTGTDFVPNSETYSDASIRNWGIRVPVHIGWAVPLTPDLYLSLATGPQLNINLYAKEILPPDFSGPVPVAPPYINLFDCGFRHCDLQWGFWAGFTFLEHYTVGITAGIGLSPEASMHYGPRKLDIRRNNVALVLSYTL